MSRIGNAAGDLKLVEEAVMKLVLLYLVIATIAMLAHLGARQTAELLADQTPI
jgi:hypothetical protein